MKYYCNYSVTGCTEEELKGLKYKKESNWYNISNGIGLEESQFKVILEKFKNYKLMAFVSKPQDSFIYLEISDSNSNCIDYQVQLTPFDYSNENLFINDVYPTDSFEFKQIDSSNGMMIKLDYENPFKPWWEGNEPYNKSFNKKAIVAKQGYYNYSTNTEFGVKLKAEEKGRLKEKDLINALNNKKISLEECDNKIKDDVKLVEMAVKNKASELKFASDRIKNDKEFIMKLYRYYQKDYDGEKILKNIGNNLKNDKEFFTPLVKKDPNLYSCIGSQLKEDLDFLLLSYGGYKYASTKIKNQISNDREYALGAIRKGLLFNDLPVQYQKDKEFALESVKKNAGGYSSLPIDLKMDKDIAIAALKKNKFIAKQFIPSSLKSDPDIMKLLNK